MGILIARFVFPYGYYPSLDTHLPLQRRNIEILKIRFGEAPLQACEVMLKDMTDSKRTDQHVQSQKSVRPPSVYRVGTY
jgi:hypothetical protein